eukprot:TRINITY_DN73380_c0_g1_i1.p1 TRINITY_DN73380_c0_g1~~TRINITY_DN73380_c0_g1_i1.p1  ORF type:complete len:430 (+),score=130.67 TRINITY_DN73380_c0_g1_i1:171-1460(+)
MVEPDKKKPKPLVKGGDDRVGGADWLCACGFMNRAKNTVCGGKGGQLGCKMPRPGVGGDGDATVILHNVIAARYLRGVVQPTDIVYSLTRYPVGFQATVVLPSVGSATVCGHVAPTEDLAKASAAYQALLVVAQPDDYSGLQTDGTPTILAMQTAQAGGNIDSTPLPLSPGAALAGLADAATLAAAVTPWEEPEAPPQAAEPKQPATTISAPPQAAAGTTVAAASAKAGAAAVPAAAAKSAGPPMTMAPAKANVLEALQEEDNKLKNRLASLMQAHKAKKEREQAAAQQAMAMPKSRGRQMMMPPPGSDPSMMGMMPSMLSWSKGSQDAGALGTEAGGFFGFGGSGFVSDAKNRLAQFLTSRLGRALLQGDAVYSADGGFDDYPNLVQATVVLNCFGEDEFAGELKPSLEEAEASVAEVALQHYVDLGA